MSKVAVIILTYNNEEEIFPCLKSVLRQSYQGEFQVVVVDNNSTDKTVEVVKNFPQVHLIELDKNLGYAGGNNIGIEWAYKQGFDYFIVLNPDMEVDIDWLKNMLITVEKVDKPGLIQSKVLFWHEPYRINTVGNPLHFLGFSWSGGYKKLSSQFLSIQEVPVASGSACLFSRQLVDKIGIFDDYYFMYHEDVDLSVRSRLAGFKNYLAPNAKVWHKYSFSFGTKKFYYSERNRLIMLFSYYKFLTIVAILPMFIATELSLLFYALFTGWLKWKIKSYGGFLRAGFHIWRKRRQAGRIRQLSDADLLSIMTGRLKFAEVDGPFLSVYSFVSSIYFKFLRFIVKW